MACINCEWKQSQQSLVLSDLLVHSIQIKDFEVFEKKVNHDMRLIQL